MQAPGECPCGVSAVPAHGVQQEPCSQLGKHPFTPRPYAGGSYVTTTHAQLERLTRGGGGGGVSAPPWRKGSRGPFCLRATSGRGGSGEAAWLGKGVWSLGEGGAGGPQGTGTVWCPQGQAAPQKCPARTEKGPEPSSAGRSAACPPPGVPLGLPVGGRTLNELSWLLFPLPQKPPHALGGGGGVPGHPFFMEPGGVRKHRPHCPALPGSLCNLSQ